MKDRIAELKKEIEDYLIDGEDSLEQFRIAYLSKKGQISVLFDGFRNVPPEAKRETGQLLNDLKQFAAEKYSGNKERLSMTEMVQSSVDLTMPAYPFAEGTRHPISIV